MIKDFKKATEQLKELAQVLNSFKSEAVQLKLVDFFLGQDFEIETTPVAEPTPVVEVITTPETAEVVEVKAPAKKPKKEKPIKKEKAVEPVVEAVVKPKTKGRPPKDKTKAEEAKVDKTKVSKKRIPNRPGPSIILNALLTDNFFTEYRTIGHIVEQCDKQYHYKYKSTDLSGTLAKLAKEGVLSRMKNPGTNQFEYIKE